MRACSVMIACGLALAAAPSHAVLEREIETAKVACDRNDAKSADSCQHHKTLIGLQRRLHAAQAANTRAVATAAPVSQAPLLPATDDTPR